MTINNPDPTTAHHVDQQPSNCKIDSCASNPKGPQIVTMHDTPAIQNPKAIHGLPNNNNVEERQRQTCDTPTKATCTTKLYGLPRDVTKAWTGQHLDNLHLTPPSTTSVRPVQGISPIRTQNALNNASEQNLAIDMTTQPRNQSQEIQII